MANRTEALLLQHKKQKHDYQELLADINKQQKVAHLEYQKYKSGLSSGKQYNYQKHLLDHLIEKLYQYD